MELGIPHECAHRDEWMYQWMTESIWKLDQVWLDGWLQSTVKCDEAAKSEFECEKSQNMILFCNALIRVTIMREYTRTPHIETRILLYKSHYSHLLKAVRLFCHSPIPACLILASSSPYANLYRLFFEFCFGYFGVGSVVLFYSLTISPTFTPKSTRWFNSNGNRVLVGLVGVCERARARARAFVQNLKRVCWRIWEKITKIRVNSFRISMFSFFNCACIVCVCVCPLLLLLLFSTQFDIIVLTVNIFAIECCLSAKRFEHFATYENEQF